MYLYYTSFDPYFVPVNEISILHCLKRKTVSHNRIARAEHITCTAAGIDWEQKNPDQGKLMKTSRSRTDVVIKDPWNRALEWIRLSKSDTATCGGHRDSLLSALLLLIYVADGGVPFTHTAVRYKNTISLRKIEKGIEMVLLLHTKAPAGVCGTHKDVNL